MTNADPFDPATDEIFMAGELYTTWNQPGSVAEYKMTPVTGNEMVYTLTLNLYQGAHAYKYFRVISGEPSWDNGEWSGGPNRSVIVPDSAITVNNVWGNPSAIHNYPVVTFNLYPNPVKDVLTITNLENAERIEIFNIAGEKVRTIESIGSERVTIETSNLTQGMYMIIVQQQGEVQATKFLKN
jgi:hypothetical protein